MEERASCRAAPEGRGLESDKVTQVELLEKPGTPRALLGHPSRGVQERNQNCII